MPCKGKKRKGALVLAAFLTFIFGVAFASSPVLAAATNGTITVKKDTVACANATIAIYEVESKYWGLYQKIGAYVATLTTNASGSANFTNLDSAKTYLAKVFYQAKTYEAKFTPASDVTITLEEVSWLRGNLIPLLVGAGAAVGFSLAGEAPGNRGAGAALEVAAGARGLGARGR
jgi:hypothetical protein